MNLIEQSEEILDGLVAEHKPVATFLMFSGGHDSLTATHLGARWAKKRGIAFKVAHINTGIGISETREYVRFTCIEQGWELVELVADRVEQTYEYIIPKYGFPAPAAHPYMYRRLKERKVERLIRDAKIGHPRGARVLLITGMRRNESVRRMMHADFSRRRGAAVWAAPLEHWGKLDCNEYIETWELRRNPVVDLLHMSGECLCGAYARVGEREEIAMWFPDDFAQIAALERAAEAAGQASCVWGYAARYTNQVHPAQQALFSPLCVGCETKVQTAA